MEKKKEISVFDLNTTASSTDCTGLIKLIPETDEEYAAYHELYDYGPLPECVKKNKEKKSSD